jgi:hypothetical protein
MFRNVLTPENSKVDPDSLPEVIEKNYPLSTVGGNVSISIPREEYVNFRNSPRYSCSQYYGRNYLLQHPLVDDLTKKILAEEKFLHTRGPIVPDYEKILQFIRKNIKYKKDIPFGYAKHPIETLVEEEGDCEDLTALASTMLRNTSRNVLWIREPNHSTIAISLHPGEKIPRNAVEVAATIESRGQTFFAVELTSDEPSHIKSKFKSYTYMRLY